MISKIIVDIYDLSIEVFYNLLILLNFWVIAPVQLARRVIFWNENLVYSRLRITV